MRKSILLLVTLCYINTPFIYSQDVLFEKEIKLKSGLQNKRDAYPILLPDGKISVCLLDKDGIHTLLFDDNFTIIDEMEGERADKQYSELLGSNFSDGDCNLFFSSPNHSSFASLSYNYEKRIVKRTVINLSLKKEKYIGSISYKNKFYLLSVLKGTSKINLYIFDNHFHFAVKTFDFPKEKFTSTSFYTLYDASQQMRSLLWIMKCQTRWR
jgi:hypothetical protein